jgi:hypothetical protein
MSSTTIVLAAVIVFLLMLIGIILTIQEFSELQKDPVRQGKESPRKHAATNSPNA